MFLEMGHLQKHSLFAWISKVFLNDHKKSFVLYRRLVIVGTECKCELLYQHENIEVLGCNIPKYIKKKDTADKCCTRNAIDKYLVFK